MEQHEIKLIETVVTLAVFFVVRLTLSRFLGRMAKIFLSQKKRIDGFKKILNILAFAVAAVFVFIIWGVDQKELLLFISSFLTVLGIAFFAQWSLLSNITSSLILFFNHPAKVGDTIAILDKDFPSSGTISEIGIFFIIILTEDKEKITVPTSLFLQKMIKTVSEAE